MLQLEDEFVHLHFLSNILCRIQKKSVLINMLQPNSTHWIVCVTNGVHLAIKIYHKTLIIGITVSFLYFLVPFLHGAELWAERLGMPCNAEHARKLPRQCVCSQHFLEIDFTLGVETCLDRLAVPNPYTLASHPTSAWHHGGPFLNSSSCEEDLRVLVPTNTYSM
jgi:hypothetical protein